mgnify:CR=1 FL=1
MRERVLIANLSLEKRKNKLDKDVDAILASSQSENEKLAQIFELFQKSVILRLIRFILILSSWTTQKL